METINFWWFFDTFIDNQSLKNAYRLKSTKQVYFHSKNILKTTKHETTFIFFWKLHKSSRTHQFLRFSQRHARVFRSRRSYDTVAWWKSSSAASPTVPPAAGGVQLILRSNCCDLLKSCNRSLKLYERLSVTFSGEESAFWVTGYNPGPYYGPFQQIYC